MMQKIHTILSKSVNIWILFIVWVLFVSNLWLPRNWGFYGNGDWDLTYSTFEAARIAVIEYGEWPSYQGFLAFGSDLDANPQAVNASIFFIPILFLGTFYGYKLSILLAMIIGLWGSFKLFRHFESDSIISIGMSFIFVGAPYFSRHIFEAGHSNFLYFYFLPWIFYHLNLYKENPSNKRFFYLVFLLAIPIAAGAPLVTIIGTFGIFMLGIGYFLIDKKSIVILFRFLLVIIFALGINSWKILPAFELWEQSPRLVNDESGISILVFLQSLCDFKANTNTPHQWHEFAIGFPLALLFFSLYKIKEIPNWKKWLLITIPLFWIGIGNSPKFVNPWYILNHYVPVFSSLRAPYRISVLSLLLLSVFFVKSFKNYQFKELIYIVLISIVLTQTLSFNSISNEMVFSKRIEDFSGKINQNKFQVLKLNKLELENQFLYVKQQCFIQNAYEPLNLLPVYDSTNNFITGGVLKSYSPSHIVINANDSFIKTSLRFSKNWTMEGKGKIINSNGLLAIKKAKKSIVLNYENREMKFGRNLSIFILFLLILLLKYTKIASSTSR